MQESSWKGIKFLRRMEIPKSNNKNVFHPAEKFDTLFYYVIFEDAWVVFRKLWLVYSRNVDMEKESIFKKQY